MTRNMTMIITSGTGAVTITDELAEEFQEAWDAIQAAPKNRALTTDFDTPAEARDWVRAGKAWAASQEPQLEFDRRGDVKGLPAQVTFRIYLPNPRGPLTEEEKAARAATRAANKAAAEAGE